jgi:dihydrofolate reductase
MIAIMEFLSSTDGKKERGAGKIKRDYKVSPHNCHIHTAMAWSWQATFVSYQNRNNMRKIIVLSMVTLDGVIQGPGGPDEDKSGGFKYGGWVAPYFDDVFNELLEKQLKPADLLLGRKTFDIFAAYWPEHESIWPGVNDVTKYVLSKTKKKSDWENSVFLKSVGDIKKLKKTNGSDIQVHGSGNLIQSLLKNELVDELWLKIYPLTLGKGKKLFDGGAIPAAFTLTESTVTPGGVIVVNYKRAGKVETGTVGA